MSADRYAALATKLLTKVKRDEKRALASEDRDEAIIAIEGALQKRRRMRAVRRWAWVAEIALVLGAGAALASHRITAVDVQAVGIPSSSPITVVAHPAGGGALLEAPGSPAPLADGKALETGSRIVTRADGHAVLSLSTGTYLTIEEDADITIVESGPHQIFAIRSGAVRAEVAKLEAGQRFVLRTPDAEIEVHGTSFRVAVADPDPSCGGGTMTRVATFEGIVSVRHEATEVQLTAGQKWPSGCLTTQLSAPAPRLQRASSHSAPPPNPAPRATSSTNANAASAQVGPAETQADAEHAFRASDLAAQNDAYARALALKRQGASREALSAFDVFTARYPSSPLRESALLERMRLLLGIDRHRAEAAARAYLTQYPAGVGRDEARAIERGAL